MASYSKGNEFPKNRSNQFKIRFPHPHHLKGSGWKVGLSGKWSLPGVDVNLTQFKQKAQSLLRASWLLIPFISSQGVVHTKSVSMELTFADILYNHNMEIGLSVMRALVFKFEQV